jgi:hypothetical protein
LLRVPRFAQDLMSFNYFLVALHSNKLKIFGTAI